jgi:hypothetical protein
MEDPTHPEDLYPYTQTLPIRLHLTSRISREQSLERAHPDRRDLVESVLDRRGVLLLDRLEHTDDLAEDMDCLSAGRGGVDLGQVSDESASSLFANVQETRQ